MNAVPMWMKNLDDEDMIFIKRFLLASGSLKEVVELIKRYVIDEDIEFDVAKNLITEYKKIKEKSKNG